MSRLPGIRHPRSLFARVAFFFTRRRLGRVPVPMLIRALSRHVLGGYVRMEMAQGRLSFDPALIRLGQVRVAMRVGCPF